MSENIDKEVALKTFKHIIDAKGYGHKEYEMIQSLQDDNNFILIESEVKCIIEELKSKLPTNRMGKLEERMQRLLTQNEEDFDDDEYEEEEKEHATVTGFYNILSKLIENREYEECDYSNHVLEQRVGFDDREDVYVCKSNLTVDALIKRLEKIKSKFPGEDIKLSIIISGTMAVDRIRIYPVVKKRKPLYDIYLSVYNQVKYEIERYNDEVEEFRRKQKELGL